MPGSDLGSFGLGEDPETFMRRLANIRTPANGETIEPVRFLEKLLSEGKNREDEDED